MNNSMPNDLMICGLHNLGNTCYMNSVIQILVNNKFIQKYLLEREYEESLFANIIDRLTKENKNCGDRNIVGNEIVLTITFQLYRVIVNMQQKQLIEPRTLKNLIALKNDTFNGFSQNDSHELLNFLLDSIHEETKRHMEMSSTRFPCEYHNMCRIINDCMSRINATNDIDEKMRIINEYNTYVASHQNEYVIYNGLSYCAKFNENNSSVISKYFTGIYHSTIECGKCKNKTHSFESFTSTSLEIPKKTTDTSLYDCFDTFTGSEKLTEDNKYNCAKCGELTDSNKKIMFWHIPQMLFIHLKRFNTTNNRLCKINDDVKYPFTLRMEDYVCEYSRRAIQYTYELIGVIHHYGNFNGGHYVAFNKSTTGDWYLFNDSNVVEINSDDIEKQIKTPASYILVYSKI